MGEGTGRRRSWASTGTRDRRTEGLKRELSRVLCLDLALDLEVATRLLEERQDALGYGVGLGHCRYTNLGQNLVLRQIRDLRSEVRISNL